MDDIHIGDETLPLYRVGGAQLTVIVIVLAATPASQDVRIQRRRLGKFLECITYKMEEYSTIVQTNRTGRGSTSDKSVTQATSLITSTNLTMLLPI